MNQQLDWKLSRSGIELRVPRMYTKHVRFVPGSYDSFSVVLFLRRRTVVTEIFAQKWHHCLNLVDGVLDIGHQSYLCDYIETKMMEWSPLIASVLLRHRICFN